MGLRLVLGLAESVGPLASMAFIRQNFQGSEQGLPVSVYIAGQTIGPACGALLGSALLANYGWRTLFAVTGLGALLWVPAWLWFARSQPSSITTRKDVEAESPVRWPWRAIFSSASFWALSACIFFISYYWYFLLTWMPAYLTMDRGYSTIGMGRIFSTPLFAMAGINLLAGFLADRQIKKGSSVYKVRLSFLSAGLLGASSMLLLNLLPGRAPVLPILVLSICSFGLASSNFWAIAQYTAPSSGVGRAIGYLNTVSQIAGVLAPIITGWSLGPYKYFKTAILFAGLSPLLSVVLLGLAGPLRLERLKRDLTGSALLSTRHKLS